MALHWFQNAKQIRSKCQLKMIVIKSWRKMKKKKTTTSHQIDDKCFPCTGIDIERHATRTRFISLIWHKIYSMRERGHFARNKISTIFLLTTCDVVVLGVKKKPISFGLWCGVFFVF